MSERHVAARGSILGSFLVARAAYGTQVFAVADAEARKLRHDPWELFMRAGAASPLARAFWRGHGAGTRLEFTQGFAILISCSRGPRAKRIIRRDLLWNFRDLGTRSRRTASLHGESGTTKRACPWQSALLQHPRPFPGGRYLSLAALMGVNLSLDPRRIGLVLLFVRSEQGSFPPFR